MDIEFRQADLRYIIVKGTGQARQAFGLGFDSLRDAEAAVAILGRGETVTSEAIAAELGRQDADPWEWEGEQAAALLDLDSYRPAVDDDDPVCVCGTHRSEHALCGCPEGFQLPQDWAAERAFIARLGEDEYESIYHPGEDGW